MIEKVGGRRVQVRGFGALPSHAFCPLTYSSAPKIEVEYKTHYNNCMHDICALSVLLDAHSPRPTA